MEVGGHAEEIPNLANHLKLLIKNPQEFRQCASNCMKSPAFLQVLGGGVFLSARPRIY